MNNWIDDIQGLTVQIEALGKDVAALRAKRSAMVGELRRHIAAVSSQLEQLELAEAFQTGDKSVVRDEAAGNGAGGYTRSSNEAPTHMSEANARAVSEWTVAPKRDGVIYHGARTR